MGMLLCLTADRQSSFVLEYGAWLAGQLGMKVTLLAIIEEPPSRTRVLDLLEVGEERLDAQGVGHRRRVVTGPAETAIIEAAESSDLVVLGPGETGALQRLVHGPAAVRLMAAIEQPLLYVPDAHPRLRRILVGIGGIGLADTLVEQVSRFARATGAEVTLLHVQPPSSYDYPAAHRYEDWSALRASDAPQARHIQEALDLLSGAGVPAEVIIRHGYPVHNILHELRDRAYDLVGLGSHFSAEGLRPRLTPNVTSQVVMGSDVPVLVVRHVEPEENGEREV